MSLDLGQVARELDLPIDKVERTVTLLDEGNTVPFITRYRKDQTGGLDEELVRAVQKRVAQVRQLQERKQKILRSIEVQGKLTPELAAIIEQVQSPKRLEDLYLPFKPKKQTLATIARERGLQPLADEILIGTADLQARAAEFIDAEKELATADDVITGVGHLIAEHFSEHAELRGRLRRIFYRTGKLICAKSETPPPSEAAGVTAAAVSASTEEIAEEQVEAAVDESVVPTAETAVEVAADSTVSDDEADIESGEEDSTATEETAETDASVAELAVEPTNVAEPTEPVAELPTADLGPDGLPTGRLFQKPVAAIVPPVVAQKKKKKKKKIIGENAFKDYYKFVEAVSKVPPHRILAINRGERARAIRVKIESDEDAMYAEMEQLVIPPDHPQAEFLRYCARDSLCRLIIPSSEREIRRELTDRAETHAVEVFIRNLRKLLLQPPVRGRRVLALDPGFKSGCKLCALDEFGNVLGHGVIFVIGKDDRRQKSKHRLAEMVKMHKVAVIVIGNGTGCREAEQLVAEILSEELKDQDVAYCVVNEAGASIYSTSQLGREELPTYDPLQRGAISIGRRLLDPLSELVKINPANIGVGLYQHDMKAKHLKESLDAVVESCVNFVGVDVNTASPALLRYVSGMNQLTARRVYEYRREHGPFRTREDLKKVPGFGEATFVQAAGFLKVLGGDNPLDATWIHPESYDLARGILSRLDSDLDELAKTVPAPLIPQKETRTFFGIPLDEAMSPVVETSVEPAVPAAGDESTAETVGETPAADGESASAAVEGAPAEVVAAANEVPAVKSAAERATEIRNALLERATHLNIEELSHELVVGPHLLQDVVHSLTRPGLDPRDNLPPPIFRRGIMKLEDLQAGMELSGTVLNVVDFGAFVDIGLNDSGLVHISRLADRYIRDPHEVVSVGDVLKVWVVEVDKSRRRVSLTAIAPGSERPQARPRDYQPRERQGSGDRQGGGERSAGGDRPRRPRPPRPAQAGNHPGQRMGASPAAGGNPPPSPPQQNQQQRPQRPFSGGGRPPNKHEKGMHIARPKGLANPTPAKPKIVPPISQKMQEGKEPLRSFSDLLQFYDKKKDKKKPEGN